jgi:hypothetical protein
MSTQVTITLPDQVFDSALQLARLTQRDVTDVLSETLTLALPTLPGDLALSPDVESLSDADVLTLSNLQLPPDQDTRLSDLLDQQQAKRLTDAERAELSGLLQTYRRGLLRKAQGLSEAVRRGLRPPLAP